MAAAHGLPEVSIARNTSEDLRLSSNSIWLAATSPLALSRSAYRRFIASSIVSGGLLHDRFEFGNRGFIEHVHRTARNIPCHHGNAVGVGLEFEIFEGH